MTIAYISNVIMLIMTVFLLLYVNDMLLVGSSPKWRSKIKTNGEFNMKDLGKTKRIIGMEIERQMSNSALFLH